MGGFVNGAATSTNLLSQFPFSIAPSLQPSLPPLPPTEGGGAATGYLPAPLKRHGGRHWVLPLPPHRRFGGGHRVPPPPPHRRCGGGKDIAGVVETYNRNKDKGGQTRPARGREEEDGGSEGREGRREGGREDGGEGREVGKGRMQGGSNGKGDC